MTRLQARALGAPVEVDLAGIEQGALKIVEWRSQPVLVLHRSDEMLASLTRHDDMLADPDSLRSTQPGYALNAYRSIQQKYLVVVGICTHLVVPPYHFASSSIVRRPR